MSRRIIAIITTFILVFSQAALSFAAPTEETPAPKELITIQSAEELTSFAKSCTVDTRTKGVKVELTADINLSLEQYVPIAVFKGVFEGNGHTISGIRSNVSGSVIGLIRYNEGEVRNLTLDVSYASSGSGEQIGGIAGVNRGYIENCTVYGNFSANSIAGGIAGENEGEIVNCSFSGVLSSRHYAGGIAGKNSGNIVNCTNAGRIDTELIEGSITEDINELLSKDISPDPYSLLASDDLSIVTDVGGIAGLNQGKIISCKNTGMIGYPNIGYNIGGIAGRSANIVSNCENRAAVQGRRDVGGIVGHIEPSVRAESSHTEDLRKELNTLSAKINILLKDANKSSDEVSKHIQEVYGDFNAAVDNGYDIADNVTDFVNSNTEELNDLALRVDTAKDLLDPAIKDFSRAAGHLNSGMASLNDALDELIISDELTAADKEKLTNAMHIIDEQSSNLNDELDFITWVLMASYNDQNNLSYHMVSGAEEGYYMLSENRPANWQESNYRSYYYSAKEEELLQTTTPGAFTIHDIYTIEHELSDKVDTLGERLDALLEAGVEATNSAREIASATSDIIDIINIYYFTEDENGETRADRIGSAVNDMKSGFESSTIYLSNGMSHMESFSSYLSGGDPMEFTTLGTSYKKSLEELRSNLNKMGDDLSATDLALNDSLDLLFVDLQAVNNQFNRVMIIIADILDYLSHPVSEDIFQDESEEVLNNKTEESKLSGSVNRGSVSGETNIGGIAGCMSFETDINSTDDLQNTVDLGISSTYFTHCILQNCVNSGIIEAKVSASGGIVGYSETGAILSCNSYGDVRCTDGNYCGGIAGLSRSIIRGCFTKGNLSALSFLGGIAGLGETISDCGSVVQLEGATESMGAIAGNITGKGEVLHNVFSNELAGGIDGVSYSEKAYPLSYNEMLDREDIPADFDKFTLHFMADGELVASIEFQRGDSLTEADLPAVPKKEGFTGYWEEYDYNNLSFSDSIEAIYAPLATVITSEEISEDSGKALLLAEGSFGKTSIIKISESNYAAPEETEVLYQYYISIENAPYSRDEIKIHTLIPDDSKKYSVYVHNGTDWVLTDSRISGSYLVFSVGSNKFDYFVTIDNKLSSLTLYGAIGAGGAGVAAAIGLLLRKGKKKK